MVYSNSYPEERIKKLYDVNVHGAFFCAREAARNMLERKSGSIILIGSMSANVCFIHLIRPAHPECRSQIVNVPQVWTCLFISTLQLILCMTGPNAIQCIKGWYARHCEGLAIMELM